MEYKNCHSFFSQGKSVCDIAKEIAKAVPISYSPGLNTAEFQRLSNRHRSTRVVFKSGLFNIEKSKQPYYHVFPDIVTVFVKARWRWTLIYCFLTYILTWLAFAGIWWAILYNHGDFEENHLPDSNTTDWTPCVREIYGFTSVFLFSIEIHTTIGYGTRILTLECPTAIPTMCFEVIIGTIMQSFIVGIVFAKLTRPKSRAQTLVFSRNALINQRDRNLCLIFRVGNIRKSRIIAVSVQAYLIRYINRSGDLLNNNEQIKLDLLVDACDDILFMFPLTVVHKIDEKSPLFSMSAEDILRTRLEILVVLEGTIESTGQPVQIRSSYTSKEILWGHRFVHLIKYRQDQQGFEVDYSKFENTVHINTPLCSAQQLKFFYKNRGTSLFTERVCCCGKCN